MKTELSYLEETTEDSRVGNLIDRLASGFEGRSESEEPWCAETQPGWAEECDAAHTPKAPKTWQVMNANSTQNSAWASAGDRIQVRWACPETQDALSEAPVASKSRIPDFRSNPKLVPGVGQDQFRSTVEMEADWQAALAGENSFATATPETMGSALDDLVSSRLGGSIQECIDVLQTALDQSADRIVELPPGAAVVDVLWELHGELEWNNSFRLALLQHLKLTKSSSKEELLKTLVTRLVTCLQKSRRLQWLQQRFQQLVEKALDQDLELEVCERDKDDPFDRLLTSLGVTIPRNCHQDIVCQSLDAIGC
jgi:hypothetical protein